MADKFVLVRTINMRGVDLRIFDFDFDLTWTAFFMNAQGKIHGRYGGRDEGPAEKGLSLPGLKYAMRQALIAHRRAAQAKPELAKSVFKTIDEYPAAQRVKKGGCIHCHQVYDFRRDRLRKRGEWKKGMVWTYPPPENVGIALDPAQGDRIQSVQKRSAADRAGLRTGDVLSKVGTVQVSSYGDVQYALNRAPKAGSLRLAWDRSGKPMTAQLKLAKGWRESDISWRGSMWNLAPNASVYGKDLTVQEKRKLGLSEKRLAFSQGKFVPRASRKAGIRAQDIIIGIDGKPLEMKMLQFNAHIRLNYQTGDKITFNVIRNGKRLKIPMVLPERNQF